MNLEQNEELAKQILRTGMYANLYDKETTYGYPLFTTGEHSSRVSKLPGIM